MNAKGIMFAASALAASVAFAGGVSFDASRHSVTFTAASTGCGVATPLEFLFVGPDSDHDYEALYTTDATVAEIADAFDKAGIPRGRPYDLAGCRLWPSGVPLKIEPALDTLVAETTGAGFPSVVFTGGSRDASGAPEAATNMPCAVFAFYNMAQALVQFGDSLEQSPTYGRFKPRKSPPKGERQTFTISWDGASQPVAVELAVAPGKTAAAIASLREKSAAGASLDVLCDFSGDLTVREASEAARALSVVDSPRVRVNGVKPGQLFYRAYLPLEAWRDRANRLAQPPEVRFGADGSVKVVEIVEDWSDPGMEDPRLTAKEHPCADLAEAAKTASRLAAKTYSMLVFASADMKLSRIHELRRLVDGDVQSWYVFAE